MSAQVILADRVVVLAVDSVQLAARHEGDLITAVIVSVEPPTDVPPDV